MVSPQGLRSDRTSRCAAGAEPKAAQPGVEVVGGSVGQGVPPPRAVDRHHDQAGAREDAQVLGGTRAGDPEGRAGRCGEVASSRRARHEPLEDRSPHRVRERGERRIHIARAEVHEPTVGGARHARHGLGRTLGSAESQIRPELLARPDPRARGCVRSRMSLLSETGVGPAALSRTPRPRAGRLFHTDVKYARETMAVAGGRWRVAGGRWQVAGGRWQVAGGRWQVAGGKWQVAGGGGRAAGRSRHPTPTPHRLDSHA